MVTDYAGNSYCISEVQLLGVDPNLLFSGFHQIRSRLKQGDVDGSHSSLLGA